MFKYRCFSVLATLTSLSLAQTRGSGSGNGSNGSNGNCTVFNWDQQPGYLINGTAFPVSGASTCQSKSDRTHDCPITAAGDGQGFFDYNISSTLRDGIWRESDGSHSFLHDLVSKAVTYSLDDGAGWEYIVIGSIDTTQALSSGTSGFIQFTPLRRCFDGTMTGCTGNLRDELPIQACAPVTRPAVPGSAAVVFEGYHAVVEIDPKDVDRFPNPFANQVSRVGQGLGPRITASSSLMGAVMALTVAALIL